MPAGATAWGEGVVCRERSRFIPPRAPLAPTQNARLPFLLLPVCSPTTTKNTAQADFRAGKTLPLQVHHLTFICRRFQKSNIGPFAHRTAAAAAAAATSTLASGSKPVDDAELVLLVNLMVAFSNVVSLRVEVKSIESCASIACGWWW